MNSYIKSHQKELDLGLDHFQEEISGLRTGRATPALVEHVLISAYGSLTPLKQLASITVPETRQLLIQPWDKTITKEVEKAITESGLGLAIVNEGHILRVNIPILTQETRQELLKVLGKKLEQARINLRQVRDQVKSKILQAEKTKEITEDEKYKFIEELDRVISDYTARLQEVSGKKEEEIMTV